MEQKFWNAIHDIPTFSELAAVIYTPPPIPVRLHECWKFQLDSGYSSQIPVIPVGIT